MNAIRIDREALRRFGRAGFRVEELRAALIKFGRAGFSTDEAATAIRRVIREATPTVAEAARRLRQAK